MSIGVFGDSYADSQPNIKKSWMHHLANKRNDVYQTYAVSGSSIWYSFELFKKHYRKYSTIVFVYSYPHRIHHLPKEYIGCNYLEPEIVPFFLSNNKTNINKIVKTYWKTFQNDDLDLLIYQKIFDDVNTICYNEGKKIINVLPFEDVSDGRMVNFSYSRGNCFTGLQYISSHDTVLKGKKYEFDKRCCHMTDYNNQVFGRLIAKHIDKDDAVITINSNNLLDFQIITGKNT